MVKKLIKIILIVILAVLVIVGAYLTYAFASYYRLDDNLKLEVNGQAEQETISVGNKHRISSSNIGFGAYSPDFTFFMDGGKESWAFSKEDVLKNLDGEMTSVGELDSDIYLIQEVDTDSTRSYHVNELDVVLDKLKEVTNKSFSYTFAQNYDSPFLFWPLYQPHGKSKSCIVTASNYTITDSIRRSLPIEEGFSKFFDLDRCYSKNYIKCDNDKYLVVYSVHLSAYTTDPTTAENQVTMLNDDMLEEYNNGNYIIAGGDMNKDMLGDSTEYFKTTSLASNWAQPFPTELLDDVFTTVAPIDYDNPIPSCRNCDVPYDENTFVVTIDGFIVSDNVEVIESNVLDNQFQYSDHNPVYLDFKLK